MKSISQSWQGWQIRLSRLLLSCFLLAASQLTHAGLKEDLETGSYVLMMRHADAPGYSDPDGYNLNDCSTQRNLGATGKNQAKCGHLHRDQLPRERKLYFPRKQHRSGWLLTS